MASAAAPKALEPAFKSFWYSTALTVKTGRAKEGSSCQRVQRGRAARPVVGRLRQKSLVSEALVKALRWSAHSRAVVSSGRERLSMSSERLKMSDCEAMKAISPIQPRSSSSRRSSSGSKSLADLSLHARRMLEVISTREADAMTDCITAARAAFSSCVPGTS